MKAYANRDPEITANNIDFSKSFDEQTTHKEGEIVDATKEVLKFPTFCYACGELGDA